MAKKLTVSTNAGKRNITGGESLSQLTEKLRDLKNRVPVSVPVDTIPTGEPFVNLFPIQEKNKNAIMESIQANGFDDKKALIVGVFPDGKNLLIDGHTRLAASKALSLPEVPLWYQEFSSVDQAVDWALHEQIDRRNLTDAEIYEYVLKVDQTAVKGTRFDDGYKGKTAARTAQIIGISRGRVEKIRTVKKRASETQKKELSTGQKSLNRVYEEVKEKKATDEAKTERDWQIEIRGASISLIRKNQVIPLVNCKSMVELYDGAPLSQIRREVEKWMVKVL